MTVQLDPKMAQVFDAIKRYKKPTDCGAVCMLGVKLWRQRDYDQAIGMYLHSLSLDPQPPTYFNMAACYDDMGRKDRAVDALCKALEITPAAEEAEFMMSMLIRAGKKHLIDAARARGSNAKWSGLGSRTSQCCRQFVGKRINRAVAAKWHDMSRAGASAGTYALRGPVGGTYYYSANMQYLECHDAHIMLFVEAPRGIIKSVTYAITESLTDDEQIDTYMNLDEGDAAVVTHKLEELTSA
jgi:tetratricopeptide (TPR) repeat protein